MNHALEWGVWGAGCLWRSMVAVARTTAVWAAVLTISVGMFIAGHVEGSHGKREMRAEIRDTKADLARLGVELGRARDAVKAAEAKAAATAAPAPPAPPALANPARVKPAVVAPARQPKPDDPWWWLKDGTR